MNNSTLSYNDLLQKCNQLETQLERMKAKEAFLHESAENLQITLNSIGDAVIATDTLGFITQINPIAEKLTGWTFEAALSQTIFEVVQIIDTNSANKIIHPIKQVLNTLNASEQLGSAILMDKTENKIPIAYTAAPILDKENRLLGSIFIFKDVTQALLLEQNLNEHKERLEQALSLINDGIFDWDLSTNHVFFDDRYYTMAGYEPQEYPGLYYEWLFRIHPFDAVEVETALKEYLAGTKEKYDVEFRYRRKNDTWMWIRARIKTTKRDDKGNPQRIIGTHTDITQQKASELALSASEEKYRDVIQNIGEGIGIVDINEKIIFANPAFENIMGVQHGTLVGRSLDDFVSTKTMAFLQNETKKRTKGESTRYEIDVNAYDGKKRTIRVTVSPKYDERGKTISSLGIISDITLKKKAEKKLKKKNAELARLNQELQSSVQKINDINIELVRAKENAEESDRLKSAFLANMSHEIRTPMNGILGFTELLKEQRLTREEQLLYLNIVERSGNRLLNIINNIIDISKIEAGQIEVALAPTNITQQIKYLHTFFKPEAEKKGIKLNYYLSPTDEEKEIVTDREKLYAILTNLIKNAIKYSTQGEIEFGYDFLNPEEIIFTVRDTGFGIPTDKIDSVFDRFIRVDMNKSKRTEGAGLGLSISKAYVEMLGGKIWVESEIGLGSTFSFTVNCKLKDSEAENTI